MSFGATCTIITKLHITPCFRHITSSFSSTRSFVRPEEGNYLMAIVRSSMDMRLLEVHPQELKFILELKKHSLCSVQLTNNTLDHVAFKVKTTSPKKYCVRPKVGIIKPQSTCEFTVRMQAQEISPPDMICKDKFLIQSTVVHDETTDEDITSSLFSKDGGKYVEEKKLGVILVRPSSSPMFSPIDVALKEGMAPGVSEPSNQCTELEEDLNHETSNKNDETFNGVDGLPPKCMVPDDVMEPRDVIKEELKPATLVDFIEGDEVLEMIKQVEALKLKLIELESKLCEAQVAISKLKEEKSISIQETKFLQDNYSELKKTELKRVQVGFPLLYLYMVALVCTFLGRLLQ